MEAWILLVVVTLILLGLVYVLVSDNLPVAWQHIGFTVVCGFGLLMAYGLIRIIFLYGFDVRLWNPFG
jgi:hypothetical protein